jgi:E3 ubiquitin-protein ligase DOA10
MYPLDNGTYIKLGKVKLRLKEVVEEEKEMTERDNSKSLHPDLLEVKSMSVKSDSNLSNQEKLCRICFEGTNGLDNPLVSLCKCMGTVKYIHF